MDLPEHSLVPMELMDPPVQSNLLGAAADGQGQFGLASATGGPQPQMEEEIKLLLLGPQDDKHLPSIFGLHDHETHNVWLCGLSNDKGWLLEDKSDVLIREDKTTASKQTLSDHEIEDCIVVPSFLDLLPRQAGGHDRRKCRNRSTSWRLEDKSDVVIKEYKATTSKQTLSDHEIEDRIVVPSMLDLLPRQAGGHGQRKCRKRSTSWRLEDKSDAVIREDKATATKQALSDHEIEDCIVVPSLLDLLPRQAGGHGQRKCRNPSTSWREDISHLLGLLKPSTSGVRKFGIRKNNKHWTPVEVKKLVKGLSEYGVGKWTIIHETYFKCSFRKAVHLKDKWRDLLRACGVHVGSKRKVHAHKATMRTVKALKDDIINLHRKHVAQKKRASR